MTPGEEISAEGKNFPVELLFRTVRRAYLRKEKNVNLSITAANRGEIFLNGIILVFRIEGQPGENRRLPGIKAGGSVEESFLLNMELKSGSYCLKIHAEGPVGERLSGEKVFDFTIVNRACPDRFPVVLWDMYWLDRMVKNLKINLEIGFTHAIARFLDLQGDWNSFGGKIWGVWEPLTAEKTGNMGHLDELLKSGFFVSAEPLAGTAKFQTGLGGMPEELIEKFGRVKKNGACYERYNPCCTFKEIQDFGRAGALSIAKNYSDFPALDSAIINSEQRDAAEVCFHEHDREAFKNHSGFNIPPEVKNKHGVDYKQLPGFPADRVVPDDHHLLVFYRWFWREGDCWNRLNSIVSDALKAFGRKDIWTWFDPAVRACSIFGSGGDVDVLSNWSYTNPDPEKVGLVADQLICMAGGAREEARVMKMTQLFWYRAQTAPRPQDDSHEKLPNDNGLSRPPAPAKTYWEISEPDAPCITAAPDHLKIAFWSKISRPIKGIMYHGWKSLVKFDRVGYVKSGYKFTNDESRWALQSVLRSVIKPLGPTLLKVPDREPEIAFLESFTSQVFVDRRETIRGWGTGWEADAFLIFRYAQFQPCVIYEETMFNKGLDGYKVLVLMNCDVLTEKAVKLLNEFQLSGGIIVADENLCPALMPDIIIESFERTGRADADKEKIQEEASRLRGLLGGFIEGFSDSDSREILTRVRSYKTTDYLFAYNDKREFGDYVGHHGLVMEKGVAEPGNVRIRRESGYVYDLLESREAEFISDNGWLEIPVELEAAGGRLWMITTSPVNRVEVVMQDSVARGNMIEAEIRVLDGRGGKMDAVVPLKVEIYDSEGVEKEFSGYYGAADGCVSIKIDVAENDSEGVWRVDAEELASGKRAGRTFTVLPC